jgi:hypothetical protein
MTFRNNSVEKVYTTKTDVAKNLLGYLDNAWVSHVKKFNAFQQEQFNRLKKALIDATDAKSVHSAFVDTYCDVYIAEREKGSLGLNMKGFFKGREFFSNTKQGALLECLEEAIMNFNKNNADNNLFRGDTESTKKGGKLDSAILSSVVSDEERNHLTEKIFVIGLKSIGRALQTINNPENTEKKQEGKFILVQEEKTFSNSIKALSRMGLVLNWDTLVRKNLDESKHSQFILFDNLDSKSSEKSIRELFNSIVKKDSFHAQTVNAIQNAIEKVNPKQTHSPEYKKT